MKLLLLTLLLLSSSVQTMASVAKTFSFSSKVESSGKNYSCSATLIKYQNQCHLLTNNHCVENKTDFEISFLNKLVKTRPELQSYSTQYASSDDSTSIPVTLEKVNHRLDLAVLSYTSEKLEQECNQLDAISLSNYEDAVQPELVKVFVVTGIVNKAPVIKFTSGIVWDKGYGATQVFYKYGLGDGLYFWHASDIDIIPGMSGSPVVNNREALVGLVSKYVDFQSSALFIPTPMILAVIKDEIQDLPEVNLSKYKNNSVNDAGNEHGGAGNEHAGAGGDLVKGDLANFRAPDEGILINNEIVLGFSSQNGIFGKTFYHQIDGFDEFQTKVNDPNYLLGLNLKGRVGPLVTRPTNGYPEVKIRKGLLERIDGFYYLESYEHPTARPFNQNHATYLLNPKAPRGLEELSRKTSVLMIDVDSKKKKISIESEGLNISFDTSYSADSKQIFLTKDNIKLTCDNKHLLKLVCHNEAVEFSLSMNHTAAGRFTKYRLAYRDSIQGYAGISYWYGAISATPSPDRWRKK